MRTRVLLAALAGTAAAAAAQPTVFVSMDFDLLRFQLGDTPDQFTMSDRIRGLGVVAGGDLVAVSPVHPDGGEPEVYEINNAYSNNPSLTDTSVQTDFGWSGITQASNGLLYGVARDGDLFEVDPNAGYTVNFIGTTGLTDAGGIAYDPAGDRLVAIDNDADAIFELDWSDGSSSFIASIGIDSLSSGIEIFDGTLYAAIHNGTADQFQVGSIDLTTGDYTSLQVIADGAAQMATSIAVIPAPASVLVLTSLLAPGLRRRR